MEYLNIKQLCAMLNRSANNIYDLVRIGELPKPVKLGGTNLWRADTIDYALEKLANAQGANWKDFLPPPPAPPALPGAPA